MSNPGQRPRVLVAEDEPVAAKLVVRGLDKAGFDVTLARTGAEAAQKLVEGWDALVTDWMMPDLDGIDLVRNVRKAGDQRTFVVVASSLASPSVREHALAAGADEFVPKPIQIAALVALLRKGVRLPEGAAAPAPPPSRRDPTDPTIGQTIGGYRVLRKLGAGGMGRVYEARAADGTLVALKLLHAWAASDSFNTRRFLREARLVREISSPWVARVLDGGYDEDKGIPYLVMEKLQGKSLDEVLLAKGALEPGPAIAIFVDVCKGLAAAHEHGVVHRDVKPGNVFLHVDEAGQICPKLCDFGVARHASGSGIATTEITQSGTMVGSPKYMSPEQVRSARDVDHRTDLYSLGLSLHEALSGFHPFGDQTSVGNVLVRVCTDDIPPLAEVAPWVPRRVSSIVDKALSKDPDERWKSALALARALEPFAAAGAITFARLTPATGVAAAPPTPPKSAGRWVIGGAVAVMLAATVAVGALTAREYARQHAPAPPDSLQGHVAPP